MNTDDRVHDDALLAETRDVFAAVSELDLAALDDRCALQHGTVDVAPDGSSVWLADVREWQRYMGLHMARMRTVRAELRTEIIDYHGDVSGDLGWSHVHFRQHVMVGRNRAASECIATIVWRRVDGVWRQVRWHATRVPAGSATGGGTSSPAGGSAPRVPGGPQVSEGSDGSSGGARSKA